MYTSWSIYLQYQYNPPFILPHGNLPSMIKSIVYFVADDFISIDIKGCNYV